MVFIYNSPYPLITYHNKKDNINSNNMIKKISHKHVLKELTPLNKRFLVSLGFKLVTP